jgi:hypothetical protein
MSLHLMKRLAHMDLEVAQLALSQNLKFDRNTTRLSCLKTRGADRTVYGYGRTLSHLLRLRAVP